MPRASLPIGIHEIAIDEEGAIAGSSFERSPGLKVHMVTTNFLVLHVPGHRRFGGQGQERPYEPAEFHVYEIVNVDAEDSTPGRFVYEIKSVLHIPKLQSSSRWNPHGER